MKICAVIGKNFGDEGKGLVTAHLCSQAAHPLVIRHNGGAQAGHTVELEKGPRFVHHQIGSGAEWGAKTLLAASFHPDLYQLGKEMAEFRELYGFLPTVFGEPEAQITVIDDVLLNMALETQRGEGRHGSCGMGINACCERIRAGYGLSLAQVLTETPEQLTDRLRSIRASYVLPRMQELGISPKNPYVAMLQEDSILVNFAAEICRNVRFLQLVEADRLWLSTFDSLIFETAQGLLLDEQNLEYAPHLTSSRTGVFETLQFLQKRNLQLEEVLYVTRSYVTRHGAGPLPCECSREDLPAVGADATNQPNEWQGTIRYARHANPELFFGPMCTDAQTAGLKPSLAVTHLNETAGCVCFAAEDMPLTRLAEQYADRLANVYASDNPYSFEKI